MRTPTRWLVPALLAGLLAGRAAAGPRPASAHAPVNIEHVLVPGDVLQITVVGEKELTRTAPVERDGTVSLGFPGKVHVAGLTKTEAAAAIRQALRRYIREPEVSVDLSESRFSVLGAVRQPGTFTVPGDQISVLEALAKAGGPDDGANLRTVTLIRNTPSGPVKTRLDLSQAVKAGSTSSVGTTMMQPGDVLYVERKGKSLGTTILGVAGVLASLAWIFKH